MSKRFPHLISSLIIAASMLCQGKEIKAPPAETAWITYDSENCSKGYVYGSWPAPPDLLTIFSPAKAPDTGEDVIQVRPSLYSLAPEVKPDGLPKCLPPKQRYYDISELIKEQGITIGRGEWILASDPVFGDQHIYFCLNHISSDVLEVIISHGHTCCPPIIFHQLATLLSIPESKETTKEWTGEQIEQAGTITHARYGMAIRSGEHTWTSQKTDNAQQEGHYDFEMTRSEDCEYARCRINFTCQIKGDDTVTFSQKATFISPMGEPFFIDCGNHGKQNRHYFLKVVTQELSKEFAHHDHHLNRKHLDKIDGIYALPISTKKTISEKNSYVTRSYRFSGDLMSHIYELLSNLPADDDDPFGDDRKLVSPTKIPTAARVTNLKNTPHHKASDTVWNLTKQFEFLGLTFHPGEKIYFNETRKHLITHGAISIHSRFISKLENNIAPRMARVSARIVSVKAQSKGNWNFDLVQQSQPSTLAHYSTTGRSGELSRYGEVTLTYKIKDKESGKEITKYRHEFEIEPTIHESNRHVDLRFSIRSKPLGKEKYTVAISSAIAIPDNKPLILELGHPNSGTETYLLILNANIISPDGKPHRYHLTPIQH